jgi:phosphotransacetylase
MFAYNINRKCLANPQRIVLPEALDPRVLHAAADVTRRKLARVILLGNEAAVRSEAQRLNVDISGVISLALCKTLQISVNLCEPL